jgi:hypothetical protein
MGARIFGAPSLEEPCHWAEFRNLHFDSATRIWEESSNLYQLFHLTAKCVFGFLGCRRTENDNLKDLLG